jgi:hypothetical protein
VTDLDAILAAGGPWKRAVRIGGQLLIEGDCREVMAALPKVDAVVTDPPYGNSNHDGDWNARLNDHRGLENKPIANDGPEEMRAVVDAVLSRAAGLLKKGRSACCCFCGGGGGHARFLRGSPNEWIATAFRFSIRSSGTNSTRASASVTGGSMKC